MTTLKCARAAASVHYRRPLPPCHSPPPPLAKRRIIPPALHPKAFSCSSETFYPPRRAMMLLSAPATRSSGAPILAAGGAALGADVGGGERIAPLAAGRGRLKRAASAASSSVGAAPKRRPPLPKSRAKRAAPPAAADDRRRPPTTPRRSHPPRSSQRFVHSARALQKTCRSVASSFCPPPQQKIWSPASPAKAPKRSQGGGEERGRPRRTLRRVPAACDGEAGGLACEGKIVDFHAVVCYVDENNVGGYQTPDALVAPRSVGARGYDDVGRRS